MPRCKKKADDEVRKRFEYKMYLAREKPGDVFDISSCQLDEVPAGVFASIKVQLKKQLFLNDNRLQTLSSGGNLANLSALTLLDLSDNRISHLPNNIDLLVALKVLSVSNNRLKGLPDSVKCLKQLVSLKCNGNHIKELPGAIGNLRQLKELLLDGNPLKHLPTEVRRLTKLQVLSLPADEMVSPPSGFPPDDDYDSNVAASHDGEITPVTQSSVYPTLQMNSYRPAASDLAQQQNEADRLHQELVNKATLNRQKVFSQLAEEDSRMQAKFIEVQRKQDQERSQLISTLKTAEDSAAQLIEQLLAAEQNRRSIEYSAVNPLLALPDEATFQLRRQDVLASMEEMLAANNDAYTNYMAQRDAAKQAALSQSALDTKEMEKILQKKKRDQARLISEISTQESVQREAFARLQSQQDERFRHLMDDIATAEWELYRLTLAEQERRAAHADINQVCLDGRRADLVRLLQQLMEQRKRREAELQGYLVELEERRSQDQMDYWLVQYQRLLDSKPAQLNQPVEGRVHDILSRVGGLDFEPNFRYHQITFDKLKWMSDDDLRKVGVYAMGVRRGILDAIAEQVSTDKLVYTEPKKSVVEPSAPEEQPEAVAPTPTLFPSAPQEVVARTIKECCICMAERCNTIFMQCGHVCTCKQCARLVTLCPLCRGEIVQRIHLQGHMDGQP